MSIFDGAGGAQVSAHRTGANLGHILCTFLSEVFGLRSMTWSNSESWASFESTFPQRLKPTLISGGCGTAEAVPFQSEALSTQRSGTRRLLRWHTFRGYGRLSR